MPTDPVKLDDADRALMRECPFRQFVSKRAGKWELARLRRIASLTKRRLIDGQVIDRLPDGYRMRITLTAAVL